MSTYSRYRPAGLLAGLVPALAASLIPYPIHANDRDLRGTPVPSAACAVGDNNLATPPFAFGGALASGGGALGLSSKTTGAQFLTLFCPLPVNNVDLSGTTNDNDITKIRVHYKDSDGFGTNAPHHRAGRPRRGLGQRAQRGRLDPRLPMDLAPADLLADADGRHQDHLPLRGRPLERGVLRLRGAAGGGPVRHAGRVPGDVPRLRLPAVGRLARPPRRLGSGT